MSLEKTLSELNLTGNEIEAIQNATKGELLYPQGEVAYLLVIYTPTAYSRVGVWRVYKTPATQNIYEANNSTVALDLVSKTFSVQSILTATFIPIEVVKEIWRKGSEFIPWLGNEG